MGQQEVYDFLMRNPDHWYTSKQISEQLAVSIGSVTMSLKKLRKTNIIKYRNTGKRNTFQYMVQSEPAKLAERTAPLMEHHVEPIKVKVKIKPKVVHQHSYLGGQTFYGVIRGKDETEAIERQKDDDFGSSDEPEPREVRIRARPARRAKRRTKQRKTVSRRPAKTKTKPKRVLKKARTPKRRAAKKRR
jgi:predicted transcriptional regulator